MRYTAIAVDYDGTIAQDGVVPSRVLAGLQQLKESGRALLLITGRELEDLIGIFPGVGIFNRVVAENGALLYRPESGERLELGEPPPAALVNALRASGIPLAVGHTILATIRPHETVVLECIAELGLEQQVIFNKGAVMVLPPGCNKASGLEFALSELAVSPRNVVAVGDGENDHALLELAEYSFATSNAVPTLKEAADRVTRRSHGDGVLEVITGLLECDLCRFPPRRHRRRLVIGKTRQGADVLLPGSGSSILVAGEPSHTGPICDALLKQLSRAGYQFCVLDTRGDYLRFAPAVAFGTRESAPVFPEIATALERPDRGTVVCLAAFSPRERKEFSSRLLRHLRELRSRAGRPHWLLLDSANDMMAASAQAPDGSVANTIFVSHTPAAMSADILAGVEAIVASGEKAGSTMRKLGAVGLRGRQIPTTTLDSVSNGEALVWFSGDDEGVRLVAPAGPSTTPV